MLDHHLYHIDSLLLVLIDDHDGLCIVGHILQHHLGGIGSRLGNLREHCLDLLLHLIHVDITNHDDSLVVGTIPLLIVRLQERTLEIVDNLHQTNRHAMTVLRAGIELRQVTLQHTHLGRGTQTPLLMDDTTLLLDLLLFKQQTIGPVPKYHQTRVDDAFARRGYITYIIDRLVNAGIGIQVCTELHADALTPAQQLVALEMLRAVEGHMLQEVRQTTLVVVLLNRTHLLGDIELSTLFWPRVVTDIIGQSVIQLTNAHCGVNGDVRHLLCYSRHHSHCGDKDHSEEFLQLIHVVDNLLIFIDLIVSVCKGTKKK